MPYENSTILEHTAVLVGGFTTPLGASILAYVFHTLSNKQKRLHKARPHWKGQRIKVYSRWSLWRGRRTHAVAPRPPSRPFLRYLTTVSSRLPLACQTAITHHRPPTSLISSGFGYGI